MVTRITLAVVLAFCAAVPGASQERFSFFVASTPESVTRMLTLAGLRDDDVVVDLGSGDGLIPLTAARMNPRLRGLGLDIDPALVEKSNARARSDGLADRVRFEHKNAFDADLRDATVVTMWLFPELMRLLRPVILERARPGTRVLTSTWDLGSWPPDMVNEDGPPVFLWIVPARVGGGWDWELTLEGTRVRYASNLEQRFQTLEGVARAGDRREVLEAATLRGSDIRFSLSITVNPLGLTRHDFTGKVDGDHIVGTARLTPSNRAAITLPWRAHRTRRSAYFGPTGTSMFQPPKQAK
jgi:SAM-dependent methyltransferase